MKETILRTLTTSVSLPNSRAEWDRLLREAATFNDYGKRKIEQAQIRFQSSRPPKTACWNVERRASEIISILQPRLLRLSDDNRPPPTPLLRPSILRIDPAGAANFRFCTTANVAPGTPFFPIGYSPSWPGEARGKGDGVSFALGLECSDLVPSNSRNRLTLRILHTVHWHRRLYRPLLWCDRIPDSIATAYEHLELGGFGNAGTLTVSALVTGVVKLLDVMDGVYDVEMRVQRSYDANHGGRRPGGAVCKAGILVQEVLYSSVCGCGLGE
ncbi:hypothetical protein BC937DRAFT_92690 [Endogone sp. FLAS-F59071]|nr:hypothetical protein BC937DRAFT_92690 [Endogone sp. FLAS-F59071]|eukprot:RUS21438.1 hypothetical protein BC937DRAFT_92690 [Endogone sp. FLAS-F59071]